MPEPAPAPLEDGAARRFLTFRVDDRLYALPAEEVAEVIKIPPVACVPHGPRSLLGLANLRGAVLPLASLRRLLGNESLVRTVSGRAIVLNGAALVAIAVDRVEALVTIDVGRLETRQAELSAEPGERLRGAFAADADLNIAKVLDIQPLLAAAFTPRARPPRPPRANITQYVSQAVAAPQARCKLVTFDIAGQEYAFELATVREIIVAPPTIIVDPCSERLVAGVASYRDTLLPLLSLRGLLGFPPAELSDGREKVVVTRVGGVLVGLLVERMRSMIDADADQLEPPSAILAARSNGEAQIKAIYRGEGGSRLVSVLSPEHLFREEIMQRLGVDQKMADDHIEAAHPIGKELKFLVFRLGDDEFALPIEAVDEVANVPEQITRLPKTPAFLEGVVNLRGEVLPVVDQRRRFDMPALEQVAGQRLIVIRSARHRAGLIVDSVSEVVTSASEDIEPAPDLTGETTQLVFGVLNFQQKGRLVLLLDPAELLSHAERGLLDSFATDTKQDLL